MDPSEYNKRGRATSSAYGLQKRLQFLGPGGVAQLPESLRLDLPDPLPGHVERTADLLERVLGAVADPEPHFEHLLLARRQRLQYAARLVLEVRHQHGVGRRGQLPVFDE